jgi:hypothetical protein
MITFRCSPASYPAQNRLSRRFWLTVASSFVFMAVSGCNQTSESPDARDTAEVTSTVEIAAKAAKRLALDETKVGGQYFGAGLQLPGIENCAEIEKIAGPSGFRSCVLRNVDRATQSLDERFVAFRKGHNPKELVRWKKRALVECENWALSENGGGSDFSLWVDNCYGKQIVEKLAELKDAKQ